MSSNGLVGRYFCQAPALFYLAVDAPGSNVNGAYSGTVRLYKFNGSIWDQLGGGIHGEGETDVVAPMLGALTPYEGYLDLSADGTNVAIGAPGHDGNHTDTGRTPVFQFNANENKWEQFGQSIDGVAVNDGSGISEALNENGKTLVIGAYWYFNAIGVSTGYTRVFEATSV
jgi:hypothetical protein